MEGVLVTAKKDGSTIAITVVTDDKGQYSFPASRLEPGTYTLATRAVGYVLEGPKSANVVAGQSATTDIKLQPTKNISAQLTNSEWLASVPGTVAQKKFLLNCSSCHSFERILKSTHDAEEFVQVFERMEGYYPGSTPLHPQRLKGRRDFSARSECRSGGEVARKRQSERGLVVGISAQDAAAPERARHARHHHGIRPASKDNTAT